MSEKCDGCVELARVEEENAKLHEYLRIEEKKTYAVIIEREDLRLKLTMAKALLEELSILVDTD